MKVSSIPIYRQINLSVSLWGPIENWLLVYVTHEKKLNQIK